MTGRCVIGKVANSHIIKCDNSGNQCEALGKESAEGKGENRGSLEVLQIHAHYRKWGQSNTQSPYLFGLKIQQLLE